MANSSDALVDIFDVQRFVSPEEAAALILNEDLIDLKNITVTGSLNISKTSIDRLPKNLHVNGNLDISVTAITKLPEGLKVKGRLNIQQLAIRTLPLDMCVDGDIYSTVDFLHCVKPEGIKGTVYVGDWRFASYLLQCD
jgi:hypothetical protein